MGVGCGDNQNDKMKIPIIETDNDGLKIRIDLKLYTKNAIIAACYKFTDKYYVYQRVDEGGNEFVDVFFESKEEAINKIVVKEFCNELIDQQLREITEEKYGHIRDLIVEEAFKPITK